MVRFWGLWALGLCLFTQSLTAKEKAGEWILTIDTPRNWAVVAKSLRGRAKQIRLLGKSHRYALFSAPDSFRWLGMRFSRHVQAIQPNYNYSTLSSQDPLVDNSWALNNHGQAISNFGPGVDGVDIHAAGAWRVSTGSKNVTVAILDTGIDLSHEDLQSNLATQNGEVEGWNFVAGNSNPQDDNGHGSFCAGIIGADWDNGTGSKGINREVRLLPVKILDFLGQGSTASAIDGIEYALSRGAQIFNLSWGGDKFDPALYEVIRNAVKRGALFVAAAGNSSKNNDDSSEATYPASFDLPGLISVAAYDPKGERASFSNVGKRRVHLGAPGLAIFGVELGGYGFRSGTSFAAPHVSGIAALLKSVLPASTPEQLHDRIIKSTQPLHPYERNYTVTGALVHAENALLGNFPEPPKLPSQWRRVPFSWGTSHPYLPDTHSRLVIREPGATHIRIHFRSFDTEQNYDSATLTDQEGKKILKYSGALGGFISAYALGEEIIVNFQSDYNRQAYGIDIDYYEAAFE